MITLILFVSIFVIYASILFLRGVNREKKKHRIKDEDEII